MAANAQGRVNSITDTERISGREIETIVEEFSGETALAHDANLVSRADVSLTPRTKSSLAKKLAKSLGFHSHSKESTSESGATNSPGSQHQSQQPSSDAKAQSERGVHFNAQASSGSGLSGSAPSATLAISPRDASGSSSTDRQSAPSLNSHSKYVSPFQTAQHQPSTTLTEASAFYSPTSSFNSVGSGRMSKAMSASMDGDGSQMRKSRLAPGNPQSYSGDLEQMKPRPSMLEQAPVDDRTTSGLLSGKSRRSSAISLKSMDGKPCSLASENISAAHHQQTLNLSHYPTSAASRNDAVYGMFVLHGKPLFQQKSPHGDTVRCTLCLAC